MRLNVLKSKIHRATVTHADIAYEGSVSVDAALLEAANILPFEAVHVWNVSNGSRLVTYALPAERGSGVVCINGAAAHLNKPGELVILATYAEMEPAEAGAHQPLVVHVDNANRLLGPARPEVPGPSRREVVAAANGHDRQRGVPTN